MTVLFSKVQYIIANLLPQDSLSQLAVVVCLQAILITLLAVVLAKVCNRDPKWSHRVWLSCVLIFLALPITHWFVGGWPVRLESPAISSVIPAKPPSLTFAVPTDKPTVGDYKQDIAWTEIPDSKKAETTGRKSLDSSIAFNTKLVVHESEATRKASDTRSVSWLQVVVGCYLAVATLILLRLVVGILRLRAISKNGVVINSETQAIFADAARCFCLSQLPTVKAVEVLAVFGWCKDVSFSTANRS